MHADMGDHYTLCIVSGNEKYPQQQHNHKAWIT